MHLSTHDGKTFSLETQSDADQTFIEALHLSVECKLRYVAPILGPREPVTGLYALNGAKLTIEGIEAATTSSEGGPLKPQGKEFDLFDRFAVAVFAALMQASWSFPHQTREAFQEHNRQTRGSSSEVSFDQWIARQAFASAAAAMQYRSELLKATKNSGAAS